MEIKKKAIILAPGEGPYMEKPFQYPTEGDINDKEDNLSDLDNLIGINPRDEFNKKLKVPKEKVEMSEINKSSSDSFRYETFIIKSVIDRIKNFTTRFVQHFSTKKEDKAVDYIVFINSLFFYLRNEGDSILFSKFENSDKEKFKVYKEKYLNFINDILSYFDKRKSEVNAAIGNTIDGNSDDIQKKFSEILKDIEENFSGWEDKDIMGSMYSGDKKNQKKFYNEDVIKEYDVIFNKFQNDFKELSKYDIELKKIGNKLGLWSAFIREVDYKYKNFISYLSKLSYSGFSLAKRVGEETEITLGSYTGDIYDVYRRIVIMVSDIKENFLKSQFINREKSVGGRGEIVIPIGYKEKILGIEESEEELASPSIVSESGKGYNIPMLSYPEIKKVLNYYLANNHVKLNEIIRIADELESKKKVFDASITAISDKVRENDADIIKEIDNILDEIKNILVGAGVEKNENKKEKNKNVQKIDPEIPPYLVRVRENLNKMKEYLLDKKYNEFEELYNKMFNKTASIEYLLNFTPLHNVINKYSSISVQFQPMAEEFKKQIKDIYDTNKTLYGLLVGMESSLKEMVNEIKEVYTDEADVSYDGVAPGIYNFNLSPSYANKDKKGINVYSEDIDPLADNTKKEIVSEDVVREIGAFISNLKTYYGQISTKSSLKKISKSLSRFIDDVDSKFKEKMAGRKGIYIDEIFDILESSLNDFVNDIEMSSGMKIVHVMARMADRLKAFMNKFKWEIFNTEINYANIKADKEIILERINLINTNINNMSKHLENFHGMFLLDKEYFGYIGATNIKNIYDLNSYLRNLELKIKSIYRSNKIDQAVIRETSQTLVDVFNSIAAKSALLVTIFRQVKGSRSNKSFQDFDDFFVKFSNELIKQKNLINDYFFLIDDSYFLDKLKKMPVNDRNNFIMSNRSYLVREYNLGGLSDKEIDVVISEMKKKIYDIKSKFGQYSSLFIEMVKSGVFEGVFDNVQNIINVLKNNNIEMFEKKIKDFVQQNFSHRLASDNSGKSYEDLLSILNELDKDVEKINLILSDDTIKSTAQVVISDTIYSNLDLSGNSLGYKKVGNKIKLILNKNKDKKIKTQEIGIDNGSFSNGENVKVYDSGNFVDAVVIEALGDGMYLLSCKGALKRIGSGDIFKLTEE